MILFFLSFIAGVLTVLAPCVLPLLPVIVGSLVGGHFSSKKAYIVTSALGISVILFTFLLKVSTIFIMIPPSLWMWLSGGIIIIFGLITLFPTLWEKLSINARINRESNKLVAVGYKKESVWGDILIGASLGPIFSSCSPTYFLILATVLPQKPLVGFIYLLTYTVGLCLALLLVTFIGQKLVSRLDGASNPHGWFKRTLGIIFLLLGFAIIFGIDKQIETGILNAGLFDITKIEQALLLKNALPDTPAISSTATSTILTSHSGTTTSGTKTNEQSSAKRILQKSFTYKLAPEIVNPSGFVNTLGKPITIGEFKGKKVVLLDIWTYSCINCQRTLPYIRAWYEKYKDQGLEIISIHTPEFSFEKVQKNVEDAVKSLGVEYPVVLDNNYATWTVLGNQFWPRKYLIDVDGFIVYDHIGEGGYDETEKAIQTALEERKEVLGTKDSIANDVTNPKDSIPVSSEGVGSPETYFGASRNEFLDNGTSGKVGEQVLSEPLRVSLNKLYLIGSWNIQPEYAETSSTVGSGEVGSDRVDYKYHSSNVYFVAGTSGESIDVEVLRDSAPLDPKIKGADIFYKNGRSYVTIQANKLYSIIKDTVSDDHLLEFIISKPGLRAFTFTFG